MEHFILSREQVREVDRRAVEEFGIPSIVLMENAGRGAADLLLSQGINGRVVVCCGHGNNGGDGFVIARHLEFHGADVEVLLFGEVDRMSTDAAINWRILQLAGTPCAVAEADLELANLHDRLAGADWIIDALLGTGITSQVRKPTASVIEQINAAGARVLAVDLPSGLDCDTGAILGQCVRADLTATFVAAKPGFASAVEWTGDVHVLPIGIPRRLIDSVSSE